MASQPLKTLPRPPVANNCRTQSIIPEYLGFAPRATWFEPQRFHRFLRCHARQQRLRFSSSIYRCDGGSRSFISACAGLLILTLTNYNESSIFTTYVIRYFPSNEIAMIRLKKQTKYELYSVQPQSPTAGIIAPLEVALCLFILWSL